MKLLDIMKKYDRCLVRESAKLTKIYNMILKESEADQEEIDEKACPDCGNDPCTCDEAEEDIDECGSTDVIPEEDFIKDEGEECEDGKCPIPESEFFETAEDNEDEASPDDFFKEDENDDSTKKASNTKDDEFMSAAEFFASESEDLDEGEDEGKDEGKDEEIDEGEIEMDPGCRMVDAKDLLAETSEDKEEKALEESLKSYRRKNHHLFNG